MNQPMNLSRRQALRLAGLGALAAASAGLPACSSSGSASKSGSGTLKVGVRSDIAGMSQLNEANGKYYGLEVDIADEMASRMGYASCEYSTVTPDSRKEDLLDGNVDCLVACYSASDKRRENFDFSPTYYEDHIVLVVENSTLISKVDDLKGGVFGTLAGANTAAYLANNLYERGFTDGVVREANEDNTDVSFDTWHLYEFETYAELSNALESGRIDAMAADGAIAHAYLDDGRTILSDYEAAAQDYAVATQKGSDLSQKVSDAIQSMLDDGTIAGLIDKWD